MLFCLTAQYTSEALTKMRESENPDREGAARTLIEAVGGKMVSFHFTGQDGPGAHVIFDVPGGDMAVAIGAVIQSSGAIQNLHINRLWTSDEAAATRKRVRDMNLRAAYRTPGT